MGIHSQNRHSGLESPDGNRVDVAGDMAKPKYFGQPPMNIHNNITWLHTWTGLAFGWLLYFVFITGTAGYFDSEIERWMQPEIPLQQGEFDTLKQLQIAEQRLLTAAPQADEYYIQFPQGRSPFFSLWWHNPANPEAGTRARWHHQVLDPNTGTPVTTRATGGGEHLYRLHYSLHYLPLNIAYGIVSLASLFMLVALISGVIIHKRIFKDFFTLRRTQPPRFWLDAHNLCGVLPLPFHLMITYSGLMLLMFSVLPGVPLAILDTEEQRLSAYRAVFSEPPHRLATGEAADAMPLAQLYSRALTLSEPQTVEYIAIEHPRDRHALVTFGVKATSGLDPTEEISLDAVSGAVFDMAHPEHHRSSARAFYGVMEKLHEGLFAPPYLRWLYFLSGLLGTAMVASGILLWTTKRRERADKNGIRPRSLAIIERLNIGMIAGPVLGIAVYFIANRLLPVTLTNREDWEMHCLFMAWGLSLLHPFLRPPSVTQRQLWAEQSIMIAVTFAWVPVINALTSELHLGASLRYGDWVLAGFDLFMLAIAIGCVCCAARLLTGPSIARPDHSSAPKGTGPC